MPDRRLSARVLALCALALTAPLASACATTEPGVPAAIGANKPGAGEPGASPETAIKVSSVAQEYEILRELGLQPISQSLVGDERGIFDVLTIWDPQTRSERQVWFDISAFFGRPK